MTGQILDVKIEKLQYFREYRSPRYPKMGAVMMKTMAKADCKSPASESPI